MILFLNIIVIYIIIGIKIDNETLKENVMDNTGLMKEYIYNKINGVKYYYDNVNDKWFSIKNGEKTYTSEKFRTSNDAAKRYYKEAKEFRSRLNVYGLNNLTPQYAVDESGEEIASANGWRKL